MGRLGDRISNSTPAESVAGSFPPEPQAQVRQTADGTDQVFEEVCGGERVAGERSQRPIEIPTFLSFMAVEIREWV
jgi:hypothetical protein